MKRPVPISTTLLFRRLSDRTPSSAAFTAVRVREKITSGFRIPTSGHLRSLLGRKILELVRIIHRCRGALLGIRYYSAFASFTNTTSIRSVTKSTVMSNPYAIRSLSGKLSRLATIFLVVFQFSGVVNAQPRAQTAQFEQNPEKRSRVFEAVEGMQVEEVSGAKLLLVAYALFWLLLFAYVVRLARIQDSTRNDLIRLERLLAKVERSTRGEDKQEPE